ncbi:SDR family oxidoreductase [Reichenbachiella sp. MALMAid0571]|uniref:SDR family oxidoreductase n=1 Tax=Reichenbachiella sp. MALMAid0571 TaxID=3143939 RepID=UPI0032DFFD84
MLKKSEDIKPTAVILGGSSGIGLAVVDKLAKEGFNIISLYRERRSRLKELDIHFNNLRNQGCNVVCYNIDALKKETVDQVSNDLLTSFGKKSIKVLVHSIANGNLKPLRITEDTSNTQNQNDIDEDTFQLFSELKKKTATGHNFTKRLETEDFGYTINAMGTSLLNWANGFIDAGLFADSARIIGLTSEGNKKVWKGYAAVSSAKVVLESLVQHMAVEYAPLGITANLIQAGITDTPSLRMIPGSDMLKASSLMRNPMERLTKPEDIANVIYLLSREEARWINGTTIIADGGEHLCP